MSKATSGLSAGYRWMVTSRVMAGFLGGYLLASLATSIMALLLVQLSGHPRADALLIATMLGFVLYAVLIVWVFSTATARRAWLGIVASMAVLGPVWWWLRILVDA